MLEISYIRENKEAVIERLKKRDFDGSKLVEEVLQCDANRRESQQELDDNLNKANTLAKEIGDLFKNGEQDKANELKTQSSQLKEVNKKLQDNLNNLVTQQRELLYQLPNVPNQLVPAGKTSDDNEIVHEEGEKPQLLDGAKPHWELIEEYDIIDFPLGVKLTGAGFPVYKGKGAQLQRALINFFLDEGREAGYTEVQPPLVINEDSGYGTGQLPDKEGQMYHLEFDNLYMIPTAEVPITNIYRDVILKEDDFPIKVCGYTPCFRREAGAWGADVRGLNRLHQFDKVEIVHISHPNESATTLDGMVEYVKELLRKLELPFRVARLCGGDLGFTSSLTYDMEVLSAAQDKWLEVSSISNFETFQANRLKLRFKDSDGKMHLAHTLNGSALALPRIVAALIENNQTNDGIRIPQALIKYTGFDIIN